MATLTGNVTSASLEDVTSALGDAHALVGGLFVFLMQIGITAREAGSVSMKNAQGVIMMSLLRATIAAVGWWAVGYAFTTGPSIDLPVIGRSWIGAGSGGAHMGGVNADSVGSEWFGGYGFVAFAAAIVSAALAERTTLICYVAVTVCLAFGVYPVVAHTQGHDDGWTRRRGAHDFGGGGVVHMTGGLAAIVGAIVLGPRKSRFSGRLFRVTTSPMPHHSIVLSTVGSALLWVGFHGAYAGIAGTGGGVGTVSLVVANAALSSTAAVLTYVIVVLSTRVLRRCNRGGQEGLNNTEGRMLEELASVSIAGLVAIASGADVVKPHFALVSGAVGGVVYWVTVKLQRQLKIDDIIEAGPTHFWCGLWSLIVPGLFGEGATAEGEGGGGRGGWGWAATTTTRGALLNGGDTEQLVAQLYLVGAIVAWVAASMFVVFGLLRLIRVARVNKVFEETGLDATVHGFWPRKAPKEQTSLEFDRRRFLQL